MGKKRGRPPDYDPAFCDALVEHMASGLSFSSFGAIAKVCGTTIKTWVNNYPEFAAAKARGELLSLLWWEKTGITGLHSDRETKFNSAVWIFTMKARFVKYGYRDNHDVVDDPDVESARLTSSERLLKIVRSGNANG